MVSLLALLENMRPKQWAKNMFIFAGIVFDGQLLNLSALLQVSIGFVLLSLSASTIYLINDLVDVERDRLHPKKRFRPIASGRLPVRWAIIASIILPSVALIGAWWLQPAFCYTLIAYLVLHLAYSFRLKSVAILDIFAISGGFILRVIAGVVVISVSNFSPYLYVCMGLLSLFLAIGKRRQEFIQLGDRATQIRASFKDYTLPLLDDLLRFIVTATAIAYTFYAIESQTLLVPHEYMLLTVPFVYYALFRYMYLIHVAGLGGDPTDVLYVDRPLQVCLFLWGVAILVLLYLF